jgi:hypothetical protein
MRVLVAVAMLVLFSGCLEGQPEEAAQAATPPPSQPFQTLEIEGRYKALKPLGETLQEEGGSNAFDVAGWKLVTVSLDSSIEVDVALLPPGCASSDEACALRYVPGDDVTEDSWTLDRMEPGTWTVDVEAAPDDYTNVDGVYSVSFEYLLA